MYIKYFPVSKVTSEMLVKAEWRFLPDLTDARLTARLVNDLGYISGKVNAPVKGTEVILLCSRTLLQWLVLEHRMFSKLAPTPHMELMDNGVFGKLGNVHIVTDMYLPPEKRFLPEGAFCATPVNQSLLEDFEALDPV